jgi:hypothetical protein
LFGHTFRGEREGPRRQNVCMQMHWGNIGPALQGFAVVIVTIDALIKGPEVVRAWIDRQRAEAEQARARRSGARGG